MLNVECCSIICYLVSQLGVEPPRKIQDPLPSLIFIPKIQPFGSQIANRSWLHSFKKNSIVNIPTSTTNMIIEKTTSYTGNNAGSLKRKRPTWNNGSVSASNAIQRPEIVGGVMSTSPQNVLTSILESRGIKSKIHSYDSLTGFFVETKEQEIDSYGCDALKAVRDSDIETLRRFHREGRPLKCSNRFGESLLHLACRKSLVEVVTFLVNEIGIPVRVKDDMGRSPLHDAFWTCEPNFAVVDILLNKCPDLLLVSDKRGHTPLSYARKDHWGKWNQYLKERSHLIEPALLK